MCGVVSRVRSLKGGRTKSGSVPTCRLNPTPRPGPWCRGHVSADGKDAIGTCVVRGLVTRHWGGGQWKRGASKANWGVWSYPLSRADWECVPTLKGPTRTLVLSSGLSVVVRTKSLSDEGCVSGTEMNRTS